MSSLSHVFKFLARDVSLVRVESRKRNKKSLIYFVSRKSFVSFTCYVFLLSLLFEDEHCE
jgi:hypothetical protein